MATTATAPLWNGQPPANRLQLLQWHKSIKPLKVDIVGDFAGKELFAIHGEALLAHCVREAKVDFSGMIHPCSIMPRLLTDSANRWISAVTRRTCC